MRTCKAAFALRQVDAVYRLGCWLCLGGRSNQCCYIQFTISPLWPLLPVPPVSLSRSRGCRCRRVQLSFLRPKPCLDLKDLEGECRREVVLLDALLAILAAMECFNGHPPRDPSPEILSKWAAAPTPQATNPEGPLRRWLLKE